MIGNTRDEKAFIIRKYLDGGLVRVRRDGEWELSSAAMNESSDTINVYSFVTGRDRVLRWSEFDVESFSFEPRLMPLGDHVVLLSRAGVQSTQRSLRPSDFEISPLVSQFVWAHYDKRDSNQVTIANLAYDHLEVRLRNIALRSIGMEFVTPTTNTLEAGIARLEHSMDVILDTDFALSVSLSEDPRPWIWYHKLPVGKIDGREIVVGHADFRQELIDYLTHSKQKGWSLRG